MYVFNKKACSSCVLITFSPAAAPRSFDDDVYIHHAQLCFIFISA